MNIEVFQDLAKLFRQNGFSLYMVGGTSRDYLIGRDTSDFDLATDAKPSEIEHFLPQADYTYALYGSVKMRRGPWKIEITTLREEAGYKDFRHPSSVTFVSDPSLDYRRRDFTINAIYIDDHLNVIDFVSGQTDIANQCIRTVGEPNLRFQEDPLRMLRALRFSLKLGFKIDPGTDKAIRNNWELLAFLNPSKADEEIAKMKKINEKAAQKLLAEYSRG